jgi:hypothetical protein
MATYSESKWIMGGTFSAHLDVLSRQSHGKNEESDKTSARIMRFDLYIT